MSLTKCIYIFIDFKPCKKDGTFMNIKPSNYIYNAIDTYLNYSEQRISINLKDILINISILVLTGILGFSIEHPKLQNLAFLTAVFGCLIMIYILYTYYQFYLEQYELLLLNIYNDICRNIDNNCNNILYFYGSNKVTIRKLVAMIKIIGLLKNIYFSFEETDLKMKEYKKNCLNINQNDEKYFYLPDSNIIIEE